MTRARGSNELKWLGNGAYKDGVGNDSGSEAQRGKEGGRGAMLCEKGEYIVKIAVASAPAKPSRLGRQVTPLKMRA